MLGIAARIRAFLVTALSFVLLLTGDAAPLAGLTPATEAARPLWGRLDIAPIVISPPAEYLTRDWGPVQPLRWAFPPGGPAVEAALRAAGLPDGAMATLLATGTRDPQSGTTILTPPADLVRGLDPKTRERLYLRLGNSELNVAQDSAYRYAGDSIDAWLGGTGLADRTLQLIQPLIYRHDGFLYFADMDVLRPQIADADELQRLVKRLLRQSTVIVRLHIDDAESVADVAEYWGRGGRRTDIRPLLESIAGSNESVDITHLLPTLARQYLYRYPKTTSADLAKPLQVNCYWTALNFFNQEPDDRFLDLKVALDTLRTEYYFVQDEFQLGDIVTFSDAKSRLVHVAVYLADNLVFGKNGTSALAPWSILPIPQIRGHYAEEFVDGWRVAFLRRKDM